MKDYTLTFAACCPCGRIVAWTSTAHGAAERVTYEFEEHTCPTPPAAP